MRIDAGHRDPRALKSHPLQVRVAGADRRQHAFGRRAADRGPQRDVGGDMDDVQPLGGEEHPRWAATGQMREQPGVAVIVMACGVQRFLVDRRRDDPGGLAGLREFDRGADVLEDRLAAARAEHPEPLRQTRHRHVDQGHGVRRLARWGFERQIHAARGDGAVQDGPVPDDGEPVALGRSEGRQRLDRHFGADARGIAHGDDDWRMVAGFGHVADLPRLVFRFSISCSLAG